MQYMSENISDNKITEYSYNNSAWQSKYQASNRKRTKFKNNESCKTLIKRIQHKFKTTLPKGLCEPLLECSAVHQCSCGSYIYIYIS